MLSKSLSEGEDEDDGPLSLSPKLRSTHRTKPKSTSTPGTPHARSIGRSHVLGADSVFISGTIRATSNTLPTSPAALLQTTSDSEQKVSRRFVNKKKKQQPQPVSPQMRILARVKSDPSRPRKGLDETAEEEEEEELKTPTQRDVSADGHVQDGDIYGTKIGRLQELVKELKTSFPAEQDLLAGVETGLAGSKEEEADPRARPPREGDPLVHVFIDQ